MDYRNAPLTSFQSLVGMAIFYLALKFSLTAFMKDRKPIQIKSFAAVSNACLALASAWMFFGILYELFISWQGEKYDQSLIFCDRELKLHRGLDFYQYIFYISKFWEYIDTIFLVLGKKDVIFLHWFHHFITPSIVWVAWMYPGSGTWFGPFTNSAVHIVMYSYYTLTFFGISRGVGHYITKIQIVQFLVVLFYIFATFVNNHLHPHCTEGKANGMTLTWCLLNYLNFLFLFIGFHITRTKKLLAQKPVSTVNLERTKAE